MKRFKTVDEYVEASDWSEELSILRELLRATDLEETVKWGAPCYTHGGKNIVGMVGFKNHFALWFHNGAALPDPDGVLINAQEGATKSLRQWRFEERSQIKKAKIKAYLKDALAAGPQPGPQRATKRAQEPAELAAALAKNKRARAAFDELTPGRRREYCAHIAEAKREATRVARVEKSLPLILAGKGLHDHYRNC